MLSARVARTTTEFKTLNTLVRPRPCFVYIRLYNETGDEILASAPYSLRGIQHGLRITGVSDAKGVLRHECLPDDHYELTCRGKIEAVEVYYMEEATDYEEKPWALLLRFSE